jgi:hypothetical protein
MEDNNLTRWASPSLLALGLLALSLQPVSLRSRAAAASAAAPTAIHAASQETSATAKVTRANWQQHPQIKRVRAIVQSVDASLGKGLYKLSKREFQYCEPYQDTVRLMATDARGRVRRYEKQAGSEDSSLTLKHTYDEGGHLRFVFIKGGAVNGSELEHRIYFDDAGNRIWEEHKYVKGPGYTFPEVWPNEELQIKDPGKAFAAASACPEVKHKGRSRKRARRTSSRASSSRIATLF